MHRFSSQISATRNPDPPMLSQRLERPFVVVGTDAQTPVPSQRPSTVVDADSAPVLCGFCETPTSRTNMFVHGRGCTECKLVRPACADCARDDAPLRPRATRCIACVQLSPACGYCFSPAEPPNKAFACVGCGRAQNICGKCSELPRGVRCTACKRGPAATPASALTGLLGDVKSTLPPGDARSAVAELEGIIQAACGFCHEITKTANPKNGNSCIDCRRRHPICDRCAHRGYALRCVACVAVHVAMGKPDAACGYCGVPRGLTGTGRLPSSIGCIECKNQLLMCSECAADPRIARCQDCIAATSTAIEIVSPPTSTVAPERVSSPVDTQPAPVLTATAVVAVEQPAVPQGPEPAPRGTVTSGGPPPPAEDDKPAVVHKKLMPAAEARRRVLDALRPEIEHMLAEAAERAIAERQMRVTLHDVPRGAFVLARYRITLAEDVAEALGFACDVDAANSSIALSFEDPSIFDD